MSRCKSKIGSIKNIYMFKVPTPKQQINNIKYLSVKEKKAFKKLIDLGFTITFHGNLIIPESKKDKIRFEFNVSNKGFFNT